MGSNSLPEEQLRRLLRRRRRNEGTIEPPALGVWLGETLELASRLVPAGAGALLLDDPAQPPPRDGPLTFVTAFGPRAGERIGTSVPGNEGIAAHVYRTGTTYVTADPSNTPYFSSRLDELPGTRTQSLVAAPIYLEQTVCGVFELINRQEHPSFSERDVALVEVFAGYVSRAILNAVDILKQNELALHDELTGLHNVRGLDAYIEDTVARALAQQNDVAVLFLDLDHLKHVNDRYGHRGGSEMLRRTARALETGLADRGRAFRFGGDEFVVVCPGADVNEGEHIAAQLAARVAESTGDDTPGHAALPSLSVSCGVATLHGSLRTADEQTQVERSAAMRGARLLTAADHALYRAKHAGRGVTRRATPDDDTLRTPAPHDGFS